MGAGAKAERLPMTEERRARGVWLALSVCAIVFVALCALVATSLGGYVTTLAVPQTAALDPRPNAHLEVLRNHQLVPESVTDDAILNEGDEVRTGPTDGALLKLFDRSTVQLYFDTVIRLERHRTSRFFSNSRETVIRVKKGTLLVSTASLGEYGESQFALASEGAVANVEPNSKVRVRVEGAGREQVMSVTVDAGRATLSSRGDEIVLTPDNLGRATGAGPLEGPFPAEVDLIRNGNLSDAPTSGAEQLDGGGLGTAAWLPIRSEGPPLVTDPGTTSIKTEEVGTLGETYAAVFKRQGSDNLYTTVGMRQEINRPAEFFDVIELRASLKVMRQEIRAGGPRSDIYPLTIKVIYRDGEQKQHEWKHSFYLHGDPDLPNSTQVEQFTWTSVSGATIPQLFLKSSEAEVGQDIQVIEAIEVYGFGRGFESWVTGISLLAR